MAGYWALSVSNRGHAMHVEHTLYEVLEVSPRARAQVIKAAYRCLVQHCHPDKHQGTEHANDRLAQINRAYAILSDPVARLDYDRKSGLHGHTYQRRGARAPASAASAFAAAPGQARPFGFRPL